MPWDVIDLRSDSSTAADRRASNGLFAGAHAASDGSGSATELEATAAAMFGQETAMFLPTGSLANLIAVSSVAERGSELICESMAHIVRAEGGAIAAVAGVSTRTWTDGRGLVDIDQIARLLEYSTEPWATRTAVISVENTHNFGGGTVQPLASLQALRKLTTDRGIEVHMDGARVWNAHVASGTPLSEYGALADLISVTFSKGLGAPVGAAVLGTAERIDRARNWRKRLGAELGDSDTLARPCLHALRSRTDRLAHDHHMARLISAAIDDHRPGLIANVVETNIVLLDLKKADLSADEVMTKAQSEGVLIGKIGTSRVRLVTHSGITEDRCTRAVEVITGILRP